MRSRRVLSAAILVILAAALACGRQSPETSSPVAPRSPDRVASAPGAGFSFSGADISLATADEPSAEQVLRDILLSGKVAVKAGLECVEWDVEVSGNYPRSLSGTLVKAWTQRGTSIRWTREFTIFDGKMNRTTVYRDVRYPNGESLAGGSLCGFETAVLAHAGPGCVTVDEGTRAEETWCIDLERCRGDDLKLAQDGCGAPRLHVSLAP